MMILEGFHLEFGAIFAAQREAFIGPLVFGAVLLQPGELEVVQRRVTERTLAVRAPLGVHLHEAEIDAQLDFFLAILAHEFPHHHLARLVIPLVQQV